LGLFLVRLNNYLCMHLGIEGTRDPQRREEEEEEKWFGEDKDL